MEEVKHFTDFETALLIFLGWISGVLMAYGVLRP
jgi:hypothetical protein